MMKHFSRQLGIAGFLSLLPIVLFCIPVFAGFATVTIDPPLVEHSVKPGEVVTGELTLINAKEEEASVVWEVSKLYTKQSEDKNLVNFLEFDDEQPVNINAGAKRKIKYQIRLPEDSEGEYASMVYFKEAGNQPGMFKVRFGVAIYAKAQGTEKGEAIITDIEARQILGEENTADIMFFIKIVNAGNVHIRPSGKIEIYKDSELIHTIEIPEGWPVFENSEHEFMFRWTTGKKEEDIVGEYSAHVILEYGNGDNTLFEQKDFSIGSGDQE